jgi:hypothetical protein
LRRPVRQKEYGQANGEVVKALAPRISEKMAAQGAEIISGTPEQLADAEG